MSNRTVWLSALVAMAGAACAVGNSDAAGAQAAAPAATAAAPAASANVQARAAKVTTAATAFLATLSADQRKQALFAFTDSAQRARWSNFPLGIFERQGVKWGDLNATQRTALMDLLGAVLSPYGVQMVKEQMDADEVLKSEPNGGAPGGGRGGAPGAGGPGAGPPGAGAPGAGGPGGGRAGGAPPGGGGRGAGGPGGGGPGGGGGLQFGSDLYYVSFVGEPSNTAPWMLQFGGHHLAVNATVVGGKITLSPTLTGGQPVKYTKDGKAIYIVERETTQAQTLVNGLTAAQKAKAVVGASYIDLVLGPGHDFQTLQPEGLAGADMTQAEKDQFLALIQSRLAILNDDSLAGAMADVRKDLDKTYFAYWGPTNDAGSAYWRVTGPSLVLEFSPQGMGGDPSNHLHNMYRVPGNDYGAAWTTVK